MQRVARQQLTVYLLIALAGVGMWCGQGRTQPLDSAETTTTKAVDLRAALDEMSALERELDRQRQAEQQARRRMQVTSATLQVTGSRLTQREALEAKGRTALSREMEQREQRRRELADELLRQRAELEQNRSAVAVTAAALLHVTATPGSPAAVKAALALKLRSEQDAIAIATQQILRGTAEQGSLLAAAEELREAGASHSIFAKYTRDQLRERHAELAYELATLQASTEEQTQTLAELESRRDDVRDLVARLIANEADAAAKPAANPQPKPEPQNTAPTPAPASTATPRPVLPEFGTNADAAPAQGGVAEVPYEPGSEPLVSATTPLPEAQAGGPPDGEDSTDPANARRLFWRATPVSVRTIASGTVVFSQPFAGYRHLLIVDHGGGWRTLIGNLETSQIAPGTALPAGSIIGRYQASPGQGHAVPLWVEVRQGTRTVAPGECPYYTPQWESQLFGPG